MRKTMLAIVIIVLFTPISLAQIEVTIGSTGCSLSTPFLPWYHLCEYSETQYGIPVSALSSISGTDPVIIEKIGWIRCSGENPTSYYSLNVYIDEVPDTYDLGSLCTTPYSNTNLLASNKTLTETSTDVFMLTLDTPFVYTPGHALIITVCDTLSGYSTSVPFWSANSFSGNGHSRFSTSASYDCNMATIEGGHDACADMWVTTVFSCTFTGDMYDLEMLPPEGTGGATGTVEPAPGAYSIPEGYSLSIVAHPDFGSDFDHWKRDGAWYSDESRETVLMEADYTIQAFFKPFTALSFPVSEDFSGIPQGELPIYWTKTPDTQNWGVSNTNMAGGVAPEMVFKWFPSYIGELRLVSPKIDGTGVSEILLMFKHYVSHNSSFSPYSLHVQTSIDDGATWVDRYTVTPSDDIGPETLMIELNEVAGEEYWLSFLFDGPTVGIQYWFIDDIVMIADDDKGWLNGVVMDDQGPIDGAVITVVETGASAVSGAAGEYELPHIAGIYTIECKAHGHNDAIEHDVEIIGNVVVTQDFYLTYPLADIHPMSFHVEQSLGESTDEYLYLENSGTGPLDFRIDINYLKNKSSRGIGDWTALSPVATPVYQASSCFGDGKFFVIGGLSIHDELFNAIQIYHTRLGTWSESTPMIKPLHSSVAAYYRGKVYVIGGYESGYNASNTVQIYDIASDSWSAGATMPTPRGGASGGLIDGKVYSLGGSSDNYYPTENVAYEYDIATNFWSTLNPGPVIYEGLGIVFGGGCAYKDKIYVGGHHNMSCYQFYEFDPAGGGIWTTKATTPLGLGGNSVSMIGLKMEGIILAVGGGNILHPTGTTWSYDPETDTWTNLDKPMTTAVFGGACAAGYGKIYFYGGTAGDVPVQPAPFMANTFDYNSWLTTDIISGSVAPGDTDIVTLTFDADEVALSGIYKAELTVLHNSEDEIPLKIPVTMEVAESGALKGFVYDDGRGTVENATVKIVEIGQTALSDNTGFYHFPAVPPGSFTVTCTANGFNPATETDVEIIAGGTTMLDFHLTPSALVIDPIVYTHTQIENVIETIQKALTLENIGTETLDWSSSIEYHETANKGFLGTLSMSWLMTTPVSGTLSGGEMQSIDLTFDSTGLAAGEYRAIITYKEAVYNAEVPVEITLIVEDSECDYLGTRLVVSQEDPYRTGDTFWLNCYVCNNTDVSMEKVATTVALGIYGEFWFWPGWTQDFDIEDRNYEPGLTIIPVIEPFTWPVFAGHALGLEFYSGLINPEMDNLIGDFGYLTFGYSDR